LINADSAGAWLAHHLAPSADSFEANVLQLETVQRFHFVALRDPGGACTLHQRDPLGNSFVPYAAHPSFWQVLGFFFADGSTAAPNACKLLFSGGAHSRIATVIEGQRTL
jgi:hypothetical protein